MNRWLVLAGLLLCYLVVFGPFTASMQRRPMSIRLGYLPSAELLKLISADFQPLLAQVAVSRVLFYYGALADETFNRSGDRPEFFQMFKTLERAIQLDPYNADPYYFAQATFTWELNRARDVNRLLDYGMKYRTLDFWLPFYAGFNAGYFLHDSEAAGRYLAKAAEMSGEPFFASLASRNYYQAGQATMAIPFLQVMVRNAKSETVRRIYAQRLSAMEAIDAIERARDRYQSDQGHLPESVERLLQENYLEHPPFDPYGGTFYFGAGGRVLTTSDLFDRHQENDGS